MTDNFDTMINTMSTAQSAPEATASDASAQSDNDGASAASIDRPMALADRHRAMMECQQILADAEVVDRTRLFLSCDERLVWMLKAKPEDAWHLVTVSGRSLRQNRHRGPESSTPMVLHRLRQRKSWLQLMELVKRDAPGFKSSRPRSSALGLLEYVWYVSVATDSTVYECFTT